jgi:hypothetical protein
MAASFPSSVKTYTDKVDGVDYVKAADVNSLQSEVNAIETALSNVVDTSGSAKIGYVQLATGSFASSLGAITVAGASYQKLVVIITVATAGSGTGILVTANGSTSHKYAYTNILASPTTAGAIAGANVPVTSAALAANDTILIEINNVNGAGAKPINWISGSSFGAGLMVSGGTITSAITSITIAAGVYPTAASYTIYGVK